MLSGPATQFPYKRHGRRSVATVAISTIDERQSDQTTLKASDEHPLMDIIRRGIWQYRLQSPGHFELEPEVRQVHEQAKTSSTSISVIFRSYSADSPLEIATKCRLVRQKRSKEVLKHFLSSTFPVIDAPLRPGTMWSWWHENGKKFDWTNLPTELKERIIEFCMFQGYGHGLYTGRLHRYSRRYRPDSRSKTIGPLEIVEQLGDWYPLLYVSHQVRTITLRLCITGGSSLTHSKGLCITTSSYRQFADCINRLGDYYQMIEPDSVPTTSRQEALSKCYRRFPRIYPHLKQYATLRHGIQKVSVHMDFLSYFYFFEVQAGGSQQFQHRLRLTYHVFERLPCLNEIVIRLPLRPRQGWEHNSLAGGPQLFHDDAPCPRALHRIIYERIAEVLASYDKVTLKNFIDADEEQRFSAARLVAVKALKYTKEELEELYTDDGGGVEVPEELGRAKEVPQMRTHSDTVLRHTDDLQNEFVPPRCYCAEPCALSVVLSASVHHCWVGSA